MSNNSYTNIVESEDIFKKLDSYRKLLVNTNVGIEDHVRGHGILFTTPNLGFFEENNFLNILGIDYELNKDSLMKFHEDLYNNILNINEVIGDSNVINDLFSRKLSSIRLRDILYKRGSELLFLEIKFDLVMNKYIIVTVDDITDSLEEKFILEDVVINNQVLVKEVHHRVKNNLQILLSLISLQERFNKTDTVIKDYMKLSLSSLSLIHSHLDSSNLNMISLSGLLVDFEDKCSNLYKDVSFSFLCDDNISLVIDKANPILLLVDELIINSIINNFKNSIENKQISCKFILNEKKLIIFYSDNSNTNSFSDDKNSLNNMLLEALISQADGVYETVKNDTFSIKISISL